MRAMAFFFIFLLLPIGAYAEGFNAGIVQGLWYSDDTPVENQTVRIYVAVRNNTGADLKGAVEFYVNGARIERNFIDALDGRIVESWADWTPRYGTSTVSANLTRTEITSTASGTKAITVTSALAEDIIYIDKDTDRDGIGDEIDTDDDNDGVTDEAERAAGTDPLVFDEPDDTSEGEATDDSNDRNTNTTPNRNPSTTRASDDPAGLEQYLTDNIVSESLSSITNVINTSKRQLDTYRTERTTLPAQDTSGEEDLFEASATATTPAVETDVPTLEVGEIVRTKNESGPGVLTRITTTIWSMAKNVGLYVYDRILWGASTFLSHPILVQITLLLLILFLLLKLANRLSRRES